MTWDLGAPPILACEFQGKRAGKDGRRSQVPLPRGGTYYEECSSVSDGPVGSRSPVSLRLGRDARQVAQTRPERDTQGQLHRGRKYLPSTSRKGPDGQRRAARPELHADQTDQVAGGLRKRGAGDRRRPAQFARVRAARDRAAALGRIPQLGRSAL